MGRESEMGKACDQGSEDGFHPGGSTGERLGNLQCCTAPPKQLSHQKMDNYLLYPLSSYQQVKAKGETSNNALKNVTCFVN